MPLIHYCKDPALITKSERYEIDGHVNLLDWMIGRFGDSTEMCGELACDIILNSRVIASTDKDDDVNERCDLTLIGGDSVCIVCRPAGPEIWIPIVIGLVSAAATFLLMPSLPGDTGAGKTSPNNKLNAAQNAFRPGEALAEIFGEVVAYPDFLQPSYFEYVNNLKIVRELFTFGVGEFVVGEVRDGDTALTDIPGSSSAIYGPNDVIPTGLLTIHRPSTNIDGQVLLPADDPAFRQEDQADELIADGIANTVIRLKNGSSFVEDTDLVAGDFLDVDLQDFDDGVLLIGIFEVLSITEPASGTFDIELDTTTGVADANIQQVNILIKVDASGNVDNWLGWFDLPGSAVTESWLQWQMPRGIRGSNGSSITMAVEYQVRPQGGGTVVSVTDSFKSNDPNAQFRTVKIQGLTAGSYEARVKRVTDSYGVNTAQEVKVEAFEAVSFYSAANFGNITSIAVERKATTFATSDSGNKINADVTRKLPTYNPLTDTYDVNNLTATRKFAAAVAYTIIVAGGRDVSSVNLQELYSINDNLVQPELGYFDFTFDDFDISLGERVRTMCNVARVSSYRDGQRWEFTRDEKKLVRSALFGRRRIINSEAARQSWQLQRPDDKDSIALTFVDPDTNTERIIYRRVDAGVIVDDGPGSEPLEVNLAGCRNLIQANNRADLEVRRIIYQRRTVQDTVSRDGMTVGLLDRVGWIDPNDLDMFDGEILGITGTNVYDTSERFEPKSGVTYYVYLTAPDGSVTLTQPCFPRTDTEFGFIADGLSGAYVATGDEQAGSSYVIASDSDLSASDFVVSVRDPQEDGSVVLELAEYNELMYEED